MAVLSYAKHALPLNQGFSTGCKFTP